MGREAQVRRLLFLFLLCLSSQIEADFITLKDEASHGKYGVVVLKDSKGSIVKEYKITKSELDVLQASTNGVPPGLTKEEWESGDSVVVGKDFEVGDVRLEQNGTIRIKYSEILKNDRIIESFIVLKSTEFIGTLPFISSPESVVNNIIYKSTDLPRILSITNGVLEVNP